MLGSIALFLALANATILNDVRNHYGLKIKDGDYYLFLAEHLPRLAFGMGCPSVVCLLSVSSVHPTDRTFWQYFRIRLCNSLGTRTVCIKILERNGKGF